MTAAKFRSGDATRNWDRRLHTVRSVQAPVCLGAVLGGPPPGPRAAPVWASVPSAAAGQLEEDVGQCTGASQQGEWCQRGSLQTPELPAGHHAVPGRPHVPAPWTRAEGREQLTWVQAPPAQSSLVCAAGQTA